MYRPVSSRNKRNQWKFLPRPAEVHLHKMMRTGIAEVGPKVSFLVEQRQVEVSQQ